MREGDNALVAGESRDIVVPLFVVEAWKSHYISKAQHSGPLE